jgi:hypothetical protein
MKTIASAIVALIIGTLVIYFAAMSLPLSIAASSSSSSVVFSGPTNAEIDLRLAMRKLWEDHIMWTRLVIVDITEGLQSEEKDTGRLLQNYEDMEAAFKKYYPVDQATNIGDLLRDHLVIAASLVHAAKNGDTTAVSTAETAWYANANDLATALGTMNPNWSKKAVIDMLNEHLKLTKEEAVAHLQGKYAVDIAAYDKIHEQALMMADVLTEGIVKQFPAMFSR